MRFIPKKPFTFILLGFVVYAYMTYPSGKSVSEIKDSEKKNFTDFTLESSDKSGIKIFDKPLNAIADKLKNTEQGRAVVNALQEQALKKKYEGLEVPLIMAGADKAVAGFDYIVGKGDAAVCGSEVTVNYDFFSENKVKLDSTKYRKEPVTFKIGEGSVIKGLENGVVGMKKGGKRQISVFPYLAYDDPAFSNDLIGKDQKVFFDVELIDIKNGEDTGNKMVKVQENKIVTKDKIVLCGNSVVVDYKFLGKEQQDKAGEISFKLGDGAVPLGIEQAVFGMNLNGSRKVTIPKELLQVSKKQKLPEGFASDADNFVEINLKELK